MNPNETPGKSNDEDLPRTPNVEHGPSYIPPYDRAGEYIEGTKEKTLNWYDRNKRAVQITAVVGVAYFLNKRAVRKVVTKVVQNELAIFAQEEMELALDPAWQSKVLESLNRAAHVYPRF